MTSRTYFAQRHPLPEAPPTNGRILVASDIVNSIDRNKNMAGASESWAQYVASYQAIDDTTFKVVTKEPYAYMLWLLGICAIVPIEAVEAVDIKANPVGSGPFVVAKYERGVALNMVRNPLYYHDYPYIDGFDVKVINDEASIQAAFRANTVDVYQATNKAKADNVRGVPHTTISRYLDRGYANIRLNGSKFAPFKDERVREAIDIALDRQAMIDKIQFGEAELSGPVPPVFDTALPKDEVAAAYKRDVTRAKELLAAAGQEDMEFTMFIGQAQDMPDQASIIKQNLSEAGITVNIRRRARPDRPDARRRLRSDGLQPPAAHDRRHPNPACTVAATPAPSATTSASTWPSTPLRPDSRGVDEQERKDLAWGDVAPVLKRHGSTLFLYQPYGYWCAYDYNNNTPTPRLTAY
jgi:peptide/nickel transport system substrate-binding protein